MDGLKINSCEEHLKEAGVLSSEESIPSDKVHIFQRLKGLLHRMKKDVFGAFPKRRSSTNAQK